MKAISIAILLAAFILVPRAEYEAMSEPAQRFMGRLLLLLIAVFILLMMFERN